LILGLIFACWIKKHAMNRRISFVLVLRVFEMKEYVKTSFVESYASVIFTEFFCLSLYIR
jgi:hypothetical protein